MKSFDRMVVLWQSNVKFVKKNLPWFGILKSSGGSIIQPLNTGSAPIYNGFAFLWKQKENFLRTLGEKESWPAPSASKPFLKQNSHGPWCNGNIRPWGGRERGFDSHWPENKDFASSDDGATFVISTRFLS